MQEEEEEGKARDRRGRREMLSLPSEILQRETHEKMKEKRDELTYGRFPLQTIYRNRVYKHR